MPDLALANGMATRWQLLDFFDNQWRHKRIDAELARAKEISDKRGLAGLKGAWARYKKPVGNVWQMPPHSQSHTERLLGKKKD